MKNYIVIPILSVISDGGAETDQRGAETEKLVPKTPKLEVPKKVPKRVATKEIRLASAKISSLTSQNSGFKILVPFRVIFIQHLTFQ